MAGQRRRTTLAPLSPEPVRAVHPSEDETGDQPGHPPAKSAVRRLRPAQIIPLSGIRHLRFLLSVSAGNEDSDVELDPVAFLLNECGVVRGDDDMVFYGQPDHPSGAVTLAADDTGAPTAVRIRTDQIPPDVSELLLAAQVSAPASTRVQAIDIDTGAAMGELALPMASPHGMLRIGALHRTTTDWTLQAQPEAMTSTSPDSRLPPASTSHETAEGSGRDYSGVSRADEHARRLYPQQQSSAWRL